MEGWGGGVNGGAFAANVKPVMETVGFIPGSWEGLFGQGHNRSELVRFYWKKSVFIIIIIISFICLCRRRGQRQKQRYSMKKSHVG